ncbi:MAG TPA: hypothetical protein VEH55_11920 [Gaiellaceae bacterium]|nr:hypothetical protein [Gaiellaceae bacterium]
MQTTASPRIPAELLRAVVRLDDRRLPIAELARRVGAEADRRGRTRPSYERIRQLVHESRALRRRRGPSALQVLAEAAAGIWPTGSTMDAIAAPREERR